MAANASTDAGSTQQSDSRENSDANSSRYNDSESEQDEQYQGPRINEKFFKELVKKEWKIYYRTLELNERLFLHCKGK